MNMKKKRIMIIGLAVLMAAVLCAVAGISLNRYLKKEQALKEKNQKASIVEVFHDQANEYMTPDEPTSKEEVTLRIRTERYNVTKVQIQYTTDKGETWKSADMSFEKHDSTGYYDFFKGTIPAQENTVYYRFLCGNDLGGVYVDQRLEPEMVCTGSYTDCWVYIPDYSTPDWAKGALWYNINPDAFYNGDASNDVATSDAQRSNSWNHVRLQLDDKYGGDLEGIAAKVEHIKDLYVEAVFVNPFYKGFQNGGYNPSYWNQVEPSLGNAQELQEMIATLHDADLKVGSDAVMTFATNDSIYFDEKGRWPLTGASESEDSDWTDMFVYYKYPDIVHWTWTQPAIDHNKSTTQNLLYATPESFMQYYTSSPFHLDSWRFDCGGWLYGTTEEGYTGNAEVISRISSYLKEINPEVLLLSENLSEYDDLMSGDWDSHWNIYFMKIVQNYVAGLTNESGLSEMLHSTLNKLPRNMALVTYNLVVNHDEPRTGEVPTYMENAQLLTMMTYIGSPSIYYGEEINLATEKQTGMGSTLSFYAMDWDESNWNYQRYNLYKGLGELRSEYSALKTGAVRDLIVDNDANIYAFGRWDDKGTVITVASQNKETVSVDLNARKLSVADGTVFTDWFTGRQYEVDEDGMLHVDVVPGGSVLVQGTKSSSFRQEYVLTTLKHADAEITLLDTDTYRTEGKGTLGTSDKLTMATADMFGAGNIYAQVQGNGSSVLMVRESEAKDAAAYFVVLTEDTLEVKARTTDGGKLQTICKAEYDPGSAVRILRSARNVFSVATAEISESGKIAGAWEEVKDSAVTISMEHQVKAGFAPIKGMTELSCVTLTSSGEETLYDDFEGDVQSAMLTGNDRSKVQLSGGNCILTADKGITWAVTKGQDNDWTFRTKLTGKQEEGTYAGVISMSDENQWVAAGRTTVDGEAVLFIGHTTDGTMQVDTWVEDTQPESPVVVQLQRVGCYYSAAYSYDEESFTVLDETLFMNMSDENVGIFAAGKTKGAFDYVCFGDSIHDGESVNTPYTNGMVDVSYNTTLRARILESLTILSGTWEYGAEGYYQSDSTGISQMGIDNKCYGDFRTNITLQLEDGEGYMAVGFGKQEYDSDMEDGFLLKYTKENQLILLKSGKKMAEATVKTKEKQDALRVVIEVKGDVISIYAGQNAKRIMYLTDTGYADGYISLYTDNVAARFMNSRFTSLDASWNLLIGVTDPQMSINGGSNYITCIASVSDSVDIYGATSLAGVGVTDLVTSFKVTLGEAKTKDSTPEAGVLLGASDGNSKQSDGISVALMEGGTLILRSNGKEMATCELGETVSSAELMVVKKDRLVQVYANGMQEPVMEYEDTSNRGGAYQLYVVNAEADFANIGLEDIHDRSVSDSELYQLWQKNSLYRIEADTYRENFEQASAWESLYAYYTDHGTWEIADGVLSCVDSPMWASGVTIYDRVYADFQMEFKYRFNEASQAWAGVLLHKQTLNDHNGTTDFSVLFGSSGDVMLYDSSKEEIILKGKIDNFQLGEWYQLRIVYQGNTLKVYHGTQCLIQFTDSRLKGAEGFLSFTSNGSMISFDDVLIESLKEGN